jgi:hypothetical protein
VGGGARGRFGSAGPAQHASGPRHRPVGLSAPSQFTWSLAAASLLVLAASAQAQSDVCMQLGVGRSGLTYPFSKSVASELSYLRSRAKFDGDSGNVSAVLLGLRVAF